MLVLCVFVEITFLCCRKINYVILKLKFMATVKLKLNKSRALKDGSYPVVFQLLHQRKKEIVYTKYRMKENEFIPVLEKVSSNNYADCKISRELHKMTRSFYLQIKRLEATGDEYTVKDIASAVAHKSAGKYILLDFIDSQIAWKKSMKKDGIAAAYRSTRSSLAKFVGSKQVKMSQINQRFVTCYKDFLSCNGVSENTEAYYMRNFRTLYNLAVKDGFVPKCTYPFKDICTKPCKTVKRALDKEQMLRLTQSDLGANPELMQSRAFFLFGFYAQGMAFVDIIFLRWKNICGNSISYRRHKSKQTIQITITPQIQAILDEYGINKENVDGYIFPIIQPVINPQTDKNEYEQYRVALGRTNRHLKTISEKLGIAPSLTTYLAKHHTISI
jgi:integrase